METRTITATVFSVAWRKSRPILGNTEGNPAIEVRCVGDNSEWVSDWIGLDTAPDFIWERWAGCIDGYQSLGTAKEVMTTVHVLRLVGEKVLLEVEDGEYNGKPRPKIRSVGVARTSGSGDAPSKTTHVSLEDDDVPF